MADQPAAPQRRHRLVIDIQADNVDELRLALNSIDYCLATKTDDQLARADVVNGGVGSGWTIRTELRPEVTHESYFEAIKAWKAARHG